MITFAINLTIIQFHYQHKTQLNKLDQTLNEQVIDLIYKQVPKFRVHENIILCTCSPNILISQIPCRTISSMNGIF